MKREQLRQGAEQDKALLLRDFETRKTEQQKRAVRAQAEMSADVGYKRAMGETGAGAGTLLGGSGSTLGTTKRAKMY
jgi:hypothetical protein